MEKVTMPAGTYYVGDLCYVLNDETWSEVCGLIISGTEVADGKFTLANGRTFVIMSTAYGDGSYVDQYGNDFPVDSGSIGCMLMSEVDDPHVATKMGAAFTFDEEIEVYSNGDLLIFGPLEINTGDEYDEDENEEENEEEEED